MHFRDQWEVQKVTVVLLACDLTASAFLQVGCFVCFLSHSFELPSIKEKMAFCCFRFAGGFIWSCREVPLHAPGTKLCRRSGAGPCMCKVYCISQLQLCFQKCSLLLCRQICPQMHFTQCEPLLLHGELYWGFSSLLFPAFSWDFFQDFMLLKKYLNHVLQHAE